METKTQTETEYIVSYTRGDALRDGVLVDVSELAARLRWRVPVVLTAGILDALSGDSDQPLSMRPAVVAALAAAGLSLDETVKLDQRVPFVTPGPSGDVSGVVVIHRGDAFEIVATLMLDYED